MGTLEDYQAKMPEFSAITMEDITTHLNIPVEIYLHEAEVLYQWTQQDKDILTGIGLDWTIVEDIPIRTGALREASSRWIAQRFTKQETGKLWQEKSLLLFQMRKDLLQEFRFAYRKNEYILGRINAIAGSQSYAALIQDLNDLSVLGKNNPDELTLIKYDMTKLNQAAQLADELATLLAEATVEGDYSETKKIRDQAFTYLKIAVDELCEYGQYAFRNNEERKKGYSSAYLRRIRRKRAKDQDTENTVENTEEKAAS